MYCNSRILMRDSLERRFNSWDYENKQTIENTNMTQPAELDWCCHATTIACGKTLRFSFFLYDKVYNVFFKLLSSESPLFIFNKIAQYNRFNFVSSYGRRLPPNNGRRTGGEKWVSSHRWEKATGKDLFVVILYCLLIKYILILVHNFFGSFRLEGF